MVDLFSDEFVRAVQHLAVRPQQPVAGGGRHAEHRSRDLGGGMEFRDFRSYAPGDDLRRVDWNQYRRSGRLFLRLFEETQDLPVYILLDCSDSMYFDGAARARAAVQMAAILTTVSLKRHDRVTVFPFGAALGEPYSAVGANAALPAVFRHLEKLGPHGATDFSASLGRFAAMKVRRGLGVVISDYFDPQGLAAVTDALGALRHRLLLVQLTRSTDRSPAIDGEVTLVDCESGAEVEATITPDVRERYAAAYDAFCAGLMTFAAKRKAAHAALDADLGVLEQLESVFPGGVLRV